MAKVTMTPPQAKLLALLRDNGTWRSVHGHAPGSDHGTATVVSRNGWERSWMEDDFTVYCQEITPEGLQALAAYEAYEALSPDEKLAKALAEMDERYRVERAAIMRRFGQ